MDSVTWTILRLRPVSLARLSRTFRHGFGETSNDALKALRCCVFNIVRGRFGPRRPSIFDTNESSGKYSSENFKPNYAVFFFVVKSFSSPLKYDWTSEECVKTKLFFSFWDFNIILRKYEKKKNCLISNFVLKFTSVTFQHFHFFLIIITTKQLTLFDNILFAFLQLWSAYNACEAFQMKHIVGGTHNKFLGIDSLIAPQAAISQINSSIWKKRKIKM